MAHQGIEDIGAGKLLMLPMHLSVEGVPPESCTQRVLSTRSEKPGLLLV